MLTEFLNKKLNSAKYKILEDGTYFGEIPSIKGVWANSKNLEDCRNELREVLEDWVLMSIKSGEKIAGLNIGASLKKVTQYAYTIPN